MTESDVSAGLMSLAGRLDLVWFLIYVLYYWS